MRPSLPGIILVLLSLVTVAGAQSIAIDDWGVERAETSATPSWYGSTGLIVTPSALVAPPMKLAGGFHRVELNDRNLDVFNSNVALTADLEFGVARLKNVIARNALAVALVDETIFNAKYNVDLASWFRTPEAPEVAVGVWDAGDELNRAFYVVASKTFQLREEGTFSQFTLHVGFGDTEHNAGALDGLFGGIEFVPFQSALVQVEYDAQDWNAALRYFPEQWLSLDVGAVDSDLAWGVSARTAF